MRQLDHLSSKLAERLDEFREIRDTFEAPETAGDLILGVKQLIDHDDVCQEEDFRHRAQETSGSSYDGTSVSQAIFQGTFA